MAPHGLRASFAAIGFSVLLCGCAAGTGPSTTPAPADGASLVAERCTVCHGAERIDAARHDRSGWESTVGRMRGKGARLSDAEATTVIDYLTSRQVSAP